MALPPSPRASVDGICGKRAPCLLSSAQGCLPSVHVCAAVAAAPPLPLAVSLLFMLRTEPRALHLLVREATTKHILIHPREHKTMGPSSPLWVGVWVASRLEAIMNKADGNGLVYGFG